MRKILGWLVLLLCIPVVSYGALVWHNSRAVPPPTPQEIKVGWDRSVEWLQKNRSTVLRDGNPILWWMIGEGAKRTGDSRLQSLVDEFYAGMSTATADSVWHIFFAPERYWGANFPEQLVSNLPDYNGYFLYSLSCSKQLAAFPAIEAQHQTDFCDRVHPFGPACVTHQMMGFRFAQRVGCDRLENLPEKIVTLQNKIVRQLQWDPRVVDVYLQRVLMLVDSGASALVKPRWIQRVLAAQLADGSWSNLQPLLPIGGGRYIGFNERLMGVGSVQGNLHATAQGIWLLSLLQKSDSELASAALAK